MEKSDTKNLFYKHSNKRKRHQLKQSFYLFIRLYATNFVINATNFFVSSISQSLNLKSAVLYHGSSSRNSYSYYFYLAKKMFLF